MPRPKPPKLTTTQLPQPPLSIEISASVLETALETVFASSLQPISAELIALRQQVNHLEQKTQQLPQTLTHILQHFLQQLQTILSSENSSTTRETLRQQLQQLIAALNDWNSQLNAELSLQQQLIDSMQQLEGRLDELNRANNPTPPHSNNGQQT